MASDFNSSIIIEHTNAIHAVEQLHTIPQTSSILIRRNSLFEITF